MKQVIEKEKKSESSQVDVGQGASPTPLRIGYIGGGSRNWAVSLMRDLAGCPHFTGEVRLYDIDRPAAEFNARYGAWVQTHPDARSRWTYRAVPTLKAALQGADFVFCSIEPGPISYFASNLLLPEREGIIQSVGDTVGPGGCVRALHAARAFREFAAAIAEHAPNARVINFTNPMSICTRTLYAVFPAIKAHGCCHEVFGTQAMLAKVYARETGEPEPERQEVSVNVLGLNHFTWIDSAMCRGVDLMALLRRHMERKGVVRAYTRREVEAYTKDCIWAGRHQVAFELFRRFGVLGAAGDRHLAEFVPWFLTSKDSCYRWGFCLTPAAYRVRNAAAIRERRRRELAEKQHRPLGGSGEEYINQMLALVGRTSLRTNVNVPNRGQMLNVPLDVVVETNALFSRAAVVPLAAGALPPNVNTWILRHAANQEALVRAALDNDQDLAFQAFLNDPLMRLDIDRAWTLFRRMLEATHFVFRRAHAGGHAHKIGA